jgi:hypothetical protein
MNEENNSRLISKDWYIHLFDNVYKDILISLLVHVIDLDNIPREIQRVYFPMKIVLRKED